MEEQPPEAGEPRSSGKALLSVHPEYRGRTSHFSRVVIRNALLGIITLGIYRFWGKTRLRRYLWSHIGFHGDRFEYTGLAKELLRGFLVALAIFVPFVILFYVAVASVESAQSEAVLNTFYFVALYLLMQIAVYRARRYRLSRTQWRSIRGGQTGSAVKYALLALGHLLLTLLTLGLTYPVMRTRLQQYRLENIWFGDRPFGFDARARSLMPTWLVCWLLLLPTLGLSYFWYRAAEFRVFSAHTSYEDLRFESNITGGSLLLIYFYYLAAVVGVLLILAAVLGSLAPIVAPNSGPSPGPDVMEAVTPMTVVASLLAFMVLGILRQIIVVQRFVRVFCERLTVSGEADFEAIAQSQRPLPSRGEGLADILDTGGI
ncbi:MAG: DUF898 family protein [Alphaproteobacteria bacterium]